jgi:hypothetical protein
LDESSRSALVKKLSSFWDEVHVECGELDAKLGNQYPELGYEQAHHSFPSRFRLGVAIANHWPLSEADSGSLQKFGLVLLGRWGLLQNYNGVDLNYLPETFSFHEHSANCPTTAMLIILPKFQQVYLSSPGCEFICDTRGGDQVALNASAAWAAAGGGTGGVAAAAFSAIDAVEKLLSDVSPLSLKVTVPEEKGHFLKRLSHKFLRSESSWIIILRGMALVCCFLILVCIYSASLHMFSDMFADKVDDRTLLQRL